MTVKLKYHGKITADKETLNYLACAFMAAAHCHTAQGYHALAKEANADSKAIYDALDAVGFYDVFRCTTPCKSQNTF